MANWLKKLLFGGDETTPADDPRAARRAKSTATPTRATLSKRAER